MSIKRLFSLLVALTLVVVVVLTVRAENAPSEVASRGSDLSDYAQRHPGAIISIAKIDLSDYFLRHPGSVSRIDTAASDWFERHPESLKAGNAMDLSDYYQRHPRISPD